MKKRLLLLITLLWMIPHAVPAHAQDLATGEYAWMADGSPAIIGQCVMDHLFTRNTYYDTNGNPIVVDNVVSFKDSDTQLVWLWLDDDQIYLNESVQALTPIAYNAAGDLYNEITYNSCQFDLYLPSSVSLTKTVTNKTAIWGDRLPSTSGVSWAKKSSSLTIDGITYDSYQVIVYNTNNYGSHFSGTDATMYEQQGALKKDDAPLLGLSLQCNNSSIGELPDMIIANITFGIREGLAAGWEPNEYNFYYGTGGNNVQQRFQLYNRVKLTEGDLDNNSARELTVCDGNEVSNFVPVYGYYYDMVGTRSQMIYPAELLTSMQNGTIKEIKFYTQDGVKQKGGRLQLLLKTVEVDGFSSSSFITGASIVAVITPETDSEELIFTLDEPFTYNGGNLLIETLVTTGGNYTNSYFYGKSTENFSSIYQPGSNSIFTLTFLPKVTFSYENGSEVPEKLDVAAPVIATSMDADKVYVTITWPETDGNQVYTGAAEYDRPAYGNPDESYEVEAYTTESETYKESEHATATILVPAKEITVVGAPLYEIESDDESDGYFINIIPTSEGSSIMFRDYLNGQLNQDWSQFSNELHYTQPGQWRIEAYAYIGNVHSEQVAYEFIITASAPEQTPAPEITTTMTDNSVIVTATGEGEVKLYIDGVEVSNPYTINRGTEDKTYTATATAQADGMLPSETATASILVPKIDSNGCYLYINDFQIPTSRLGDEIVVPVKAHFDARVSGWVVNLTVPEGLTPVFAEAGGATTVTYLDARGNQQTLKTSFSHNAQYTSMLSYIGSEGYWLPEGASQYESYGVVKWEAGDYGEMALLYLEVDPDFAGGQIVVDSECSSGRDARGGTVPPGERHIYTATFTVGGQELEGELLIGDCDANGMVPVSYTGSEDIILEVLLDGQAAALVDGKAQLMHYGTTTISATATALGHMPLHATATVNWTAINNGDWEILKAFYNQYKNEVLVWDMSDRNKPNSCPGVSSENGRVTAIELPNHQLEGGFPTMLLSLDNLTVLDLSYNNLSGDASSDMTQYAAASGIKARGLQELYINNNDFTGNVGALASLFGNLTTLDVSANHFGQVDPLVNPAVNLSLSNQVLEMNGDITAGLGVLASSLPTICLYDHAGQTFSWDASINLKDMAQSPEWDMELWLEEYSAVDNNLYYSWVSGPYRGANGQTLDGYTYLYNSNEDNRQHLLVQFTFNPGDANFNGPVDITDLQAMVNYIFGDYNRLFNFTAANLNNDAIINVQDVVGEANLLLSMELTMPAPALHRAPALDEALTQASLYWEDGTLYLNTTVPVTALDIVNDAEGDITWNVADKGFMVRNATSGQGAHTVIYSLGDAVIEPGVTAIATTTGRTPSVVAAKLSNADAELVEVRLNDRLTGLKSLNEDGKPQCYINGTNLVIASGTGLDNVDIDIYTVDGQKVWGKHVNRLEGGNTSIDLSEIASGHRYYIIVVRNGRQIIATQKLTQIR